VHLWDANSPGTRGIILASMAELLSDCEEDRTLRAGLVGLLREADPPLWGESSARAARLADDLG
jgi:hypothetical protein